MCADVCFVRGICSHTSCDVIVQKLGIKSNSVQKEGFPYPWGANAVASLGKQKSQHGRVVRAGKQGGGEPRVRAEGERPGWKEQRPGGPLVAGRGVEASPGKPTPELRAGCLAGGGGLQRTSQGRQLRWSPWS